MKKLIGGRNLDQSWRNPQKVSRSARTPVWIVAFLLAFAPFARAERTKLKPGWNLFSTADDVAYGREVATDAERKFQMLNDPRVDGYLNALGQRLAAKAPGERYPYQFKCVNDSTINAFALPGGFLYVNRGTIVAADSEAQLAGVIGHEIGHVALRHGTNQVTKAYAAQVPLAILGGVLGSNSLGAVLAQLGAEFTADSVLLKFSRDAERQADLIGTQILYDNNYDPRAMAQFFEKIQAESKRGRPLTFFSSHPSPENRIGNVNEEIRKMGGTQSGYKTDSPEFREIKKNVESLPAPRGAGGPTRPSAPSSSGRPPQPSQRYQSLDSYSLKLVFPDNWRAYGEDPSFTIAPEGGIVDDGRGNKLLAYGVIVSVFEPHADRHSHRTLEEATDQLIDHLRNSNPHMRVVKDHQSARIGGERAMYTLLSNESPLRGQEYNWMLTVMRPEGLRYIVCVAPERDYEEYKRAFKVVLDSIRFNR